MEEESCLPWAGVELEVARWEVAESSWRGESSRKDVIEDLGWSCGNDIVGVSRQDQAVDIIRVFRNEVITNNGTEAMACVDDLLEGVW